MNVEELASSEVAAALFGDLSGAMLRCRDVVRDQVLHEFATESDPFGVPWTPWYWTSEYPAQEHPTLQLSGLLRASFVTEQAGHIEEVTPNSLEFGSEVQYAMSHQEGGKRITTVDLYGRQGGFLAAGTEINLPARPIVGWPEETIVECAGHVRAEVESEWYGL